MSGYFPMDLLMDLCLLCSVQLALDQLRPRRLLAALAVLSLHTVAASILPLLKSGPALLAGSFAASAVLTGCTGIRKTMEAAACMLCIAAACGGFASIASAGSRQVFPMALAGAALTLALLRERRHIRFRWNIEVYVERDGLYANFPALIDTGNRLREHRSGLPVLIVEAGAMPNLAEYALSLDPGQKRMLPFGVLGSSGEICCFQADNVQLRIPGRCWTDAPDCWIAVYHGRIPGRIRALAPPEFTDAAEDNRPMSFWIQNTMRRFYYVIFKREAIHLRPGGSDSEGFRMLHRRQ